MGEGVILGLMEVMQVIFTTLKILILASVIVSWVGADPHNPIVQILRSVTEPLYRPIRGMTARLPGPIDWSPMILLLLLIFLERVVERTLSSML